MGISTSSCSCMYLTASAKVIDADGTVTHYARPVRASELMLDHPGHFVCSSDRLAVGCRVPGLAADRLLEPRRAYFLLPMDMLYSVLTDEEKAALSCRAARAHSRKGTTTGGGRRPESNVVKIVPVRGPFQQADAAAAAHNEHVGGVKTGGGVRRQRSWQPALDTIEEVP